MASLISGMELNLAIDGDNQLDTHYTAEVYFGTPSQKMNVLFDTGSSDAWIYSNDQCQQSTNYCPKDVDKFNETKSTTLNNYDDQQLNITYNIGLGQSALIEGNIASDRFCL